MTDPSLSTLRKLSAALDVPTYLFMGGDVDTGLTTRKSDIITLSQPHTSIRYHLLTPMPSATFSPQSLVIRFELDAHTADGEMPVIHPSEEIILLESGTLDIDISGETIHSEAGDSTIILANAPHSVFNPSDQTVVGLSIFTPAIWFPNTKRYKP